MTPTGAPGDARGVVLGDDPEARRRRAQTVDGEQRTLVRTLSRDFVRFLLLVQEVQRDALYRDLGYSDIAVYYDLHVGYAWRSIRRRLVILEALDRLTDPDERATVQAQMETIGVHKAAVLAPMIGEAGAPWQRWLQKAGDVDEGALQMAVSQWRGAKPRGAVEGASEKPAAPASSRWLTYTVNQIADDGARAELRNVFSAGRVVLESDSDLYVLLALVREQKVEWYHVAMAQGWSPPVAEGGAEVNVEQEVTT